jgi:hypothetical protein
VKTYIGIDPGLDGAVAIIEEGKDPFLFDTPTLEVGDKRDYDGREMALILKSFNENAVVALESVHAFPGQGVTSMFRMGAGLGRWQGILDALGMVYSMIPPQRWKKELMDGMPKEKSASIIRAKQLFPRADIRLKKHDGRADALLLAEYLRRKS